MANSLVAVERRLKALEEQRSSEHKITGLGGLLRALNEGWQPGEDTTSGVSGGLAVLMAAIEQDAKAP